MWLSYYLIFLLCFDCNGLNSNELFQLISGTSFSKRDSQSNRRDIERWFISSQNKQFLMKINDTSLCIGLFIGYLYTGSLKTQSYQSTGLSLLRINHQTFNCVYMSNINPNIRRKWKPRIRQVTSFSFLLFL
jgi:hypothetical protein